MDSLKISLDLQQAACRREPVPSYSERRADLKNLKRLLTDNTDAIVDAICEDYGNRSRHETIFAELIPSLDGLDHALRNLRDWMRGRRRPVDSLLFPGGRNYVVPRPLGVVGLIMPWNFPINLAFIQLTAVFAAGNRAMVKMSENSIVLSRLLREITPQYFPEDKLLFIEETGGVGIAFSKLSLDLIIFTGSTQTGRAVMASASQNLTPVVLELGGKSPAVIDHGFPMEKAVERIMYAKQFNAGQVCTSVDYVFVEEDRKDHFVELARAWAGKHVPDIHSQDYTSIIDERSYRRLIETLEDARVKGARVINLCGDQEPAAAQRKIPLYLVLDTSDDMTIRSRETFGPVLMVLTYREHEEVIEFINRHPDPLAVYPFTHDRAVVKRYIESVPCGGLTVNDTLFHVLQHDLPFGGLGQSGMGQYHGREGFEACSKIVPVFHQARWTAMKFVSPPYKGLATRAMDWLMKLKG